ncbi:hypothetical protein [uncultured Psychroserpens sp.]|uniref:hypothetical protein n=1 Tax=uncultured Psychroserpens sp. TaxID=255436 RepID=UPI00263516F8|nr:hypothetical protein [uncultured Psychroserpens sp.]
MKKFLIYFILFNSLFAIAQTERDVLINDIQNSIKAYNESDFETLLKYFPKFVFDNISKEELLKELSKNHKIKTIDISEIKIDTIMTIDSVKYAKFQIGSNTPSYGIKNNSNWTFIDANEKTKKYIPIEIR